MLADRMRMAASGERLDKYTKVLLHMNGADYGTIFTDETGKIWTANGAKTLALQSKFGGTSAFFSGSSWIDTPAHEDFNVGNGDFTIDFWLRIPSASSVGYIFGQSSTVDYDTNVQFMCYIDNSYLKAHFYKSDGSASTFSGTKLAIDTWYHVAFVRNGQYITLYIDGVEKSFLYATGVTYRASAYKFSIGRLGECTYTFLNGWVDEFRFSKGIARWTSNFTPPTKEY